MSFRSYTFSDNAQLSMNIHDRAFFEREKLLAAAFVRHHPCRAEADACPLCESADIELFAVIADVRYLRCENCWSLFVPVDKEVMTEYRQYAPLRNFRESKEYQAAAEQIRAYVWREQLFWLEFRSSRYLRPLSELHVVEIGGRHRGFSELLKRGCASYRAFSFTEEAAPDQADVILYLGLLTCETDPIETLRRIRGFLPGDGLLFLNSRVSTGFDILTLKGGLDNIFPYEHAILPSMEALTSILKKAGFSVLEIVTPGALDVRYVMENSSKLERNDLFIRYLLEKSDDCGRMEFQKFLQKNAMSSYAQLVARVA